MSEGDSVTEVTSTGFVERMMNSVGGALLGLGLFGASFFVLWWNEGNVVAEKEAIAELQQFSEIKVDATSESFNNKIVHTSGKLDSVERLGDTFLVPGPYLNLQRTVEMYQWVEKKETKTEKKTGGGETKKTTYRYIKDWEENYQDSSRFKKQAGHINPSMPYKSEALKVKSSTFGKFNGNPVLERISAGDPLTLKPEMLRNDGFKQVGNYFIKRVNTNSQADSVGDIRVSYTAALAGGTYSILAKQTSPATLEAHIAENGKEQFLVASGTISAKKMINDAEAAAETMANVLRIVGFIMMFIGMNLVLAPFATFLDILPILGAAGRFVTGVFSFLVAGVLSATTIILGMIAHNPIVLALVLGGSGFGIFYLYKKAKAKKALATAGSGPRAVPTEASEQEPPRATGT